MSLFEENATREKLLVLYFFSVTDFVLTADQISRVFLRNEWADYFSLHQTLSDLSEAHLLALVNRPNGLCYAISEQGRQTLAQFRARLPLSLRQEVESYALSARRSIQKETQNTASYTRSKEGEYLVTCNIIEGERVLLTLTLNVVSAEMAATIANRWADGAPDAYRSLLSILAKPEGE